MSRSRTFPKWYPFITKLVSIGNDYNSKGNTSDKKKINIRDKPKPNKRDYILGLELQLHMIIQLDSETELKTANTTSSIKNLSSIEKLAFTSGVFDLMHAGHIRFLTKAKGLLPPDVKLLIAIHDDESVTKNKGSDRPIFPEQERLEILNQIKAVDYVGIWQGWESITDLVLKLKPAFLVSTEDNLANQNQTWEQNWHKVAQQVGAEIISVPKGKTADQKEQKNSQEPSTSHYLQKIRQSSWLAAE